MDAVERIGDVSSGHSKKHEVKAIGLEVDAERISS